MGHFNAYRLAPVLLAGLCGPVTALAQDSPSGASLAAPYGECTLGYWSSNRNLDDRSDLPAAHCALNWKPRLSADARIGIDLQLGWQNNLRADNANHRVREAYLEFDKEALSMRLGRQIMAWGRADRINPTDWLSPKDFSLLAFDDEAQRIGIDAAKFSYAFNPSFSASLVVARFEAHVTPQGALPVNLVKPDPPNRVEWAAKLDHSGQGLDWSVSVFDGFDRFTRYRLDLSAPAAPMFRGDFERQLSIGADFASARGAWTWRGEVSHSKFRPSCTACPTYERSVNAAVIGADRDFADTMNVNLQLFTVHRPDFAAPTGAPGLLQTLESGLNRLNREYAGQESGITLRLSDRLLNERLKWEISAVLDLTRKSRLIRPRVTWAVSDHLKLSGGFDFYSGDVQSAFGDLRTNQLAFLMLGLVF